MIELVLGLPQALVEPVSVPRKTIPSRRRIEVGDIRKFPLPSLA